jgi:hypothetical protein
MGFKRKGCASPREEIQFWRGARLVPPKATLYLHNALPVFRNAAAAENGWQEAVELLLANKAGLNAKDNKGEIPMVLAKLKGQ